MSTRNPTPGPSDQEKPGSSGHIENLRAEHRRHERLEAVAEIRSQTTKEGAQALRRIASTVTEDPIVRAAAIAALAAHGQATTLEEDPPPAVKSAALKAEASLARQRVVAAAEAGEIIRLPEVTVMPSSGSEVPIVTRKLRPSEARSAAASSSLDTATVGDVRAFYCEGYEDTEYAVLLGTDFDPTRLLRSSARLAQVAVHHTDEEDIWAEPLEVLTTSIGDGQVQILVVNDRNEPQFAGSATVHGKEVVFEIGVVSRPGWSDATIRGRIVDGRVTVDKAVAGTQAVAPRRPRPLI